jgi:hypothetical protein
MDGDRSGWECFKEKKDHAKVIVLRMAFLSDKLLDSKRGNELNTTCIAHAENRASFYRDRADVGAGIALRVGGDIGQGQA